MVVWRRMFRLKSILGIYFMPNTGAYVAAIMRLLLFNQNTLGLLVNLRFDSSLAAKRYVFSG